MTSEAAIGSAEIRRLILLTETLSERLQAETAAFAARRPQDVTASLVETQELANQYRRESAQLKANRAMLTAAPASERMALIRATETFEDILATHGRAVDAARTISEGLVRTIAHEISAARAVGTGYGASGQAALGDGRAITFNRTA
jgi:hypothetical protein